MPEKKNQHFVHQSYLRNFSEDENSIRAFLHNEGKFIDTASISGQCSKDYLYGKDLVLENFFGKLESEGIRIISEIINENKIFDKGSKEHHIFLVYLFSFKLRNPATFTENQQIEEKFQQHIDEIAENHGVQSTSMTSDLSREEYFFRNISKFLWWHGLGASDLEYNIMKSTKGNSFITSDVPLVMYNKFLLGTKHSFGGKVGINLMGLVVFLPISPEYCIIFYDSGVYKISDGKTKVVDIDEQGVKDINLLQYWNSEKNIYFKYKNQQEQILKTFLRGKKFKLKEREKLVHAFGVFSFFYEDIVESYKPKLEFLKIHKLGKRKSDRFIKYPVGNIIPYMRKSRNVREIEYLSSERHKSDKKGHIAFEKLLSHDTVMLEFLANITDIFTEIIAPSKDKQ